MPTPGSVRRYVNTGWYTEGSFVLLVPTPADLPSVPDDDGVFCFVLSEERLYYAKGGVWTRYAASPRTYASVAALPATGSFVGQAVVTTDTGTLFVWTGSYWRPQIGPQTFAVGLSAASVAGSTVTLGTISIPAVAWPRIVTASAMTLFAGSITAASSFQLTLVHLSGANLAARCSGPANFATATVPPHSQVLAANTVGTLSATAVRGSGSETATVSAGSSFCRMEAVAVPQ